MKLPETGFWKKQELANQFVHFGISFLSGLLFYWSIYWVFHVKFDATLCVGCIIGTIVETVQAIKLTKEEAISRATDDIRDLLFWCFGSILLFIMKYYPL